MLAIIYIFTTLVSVFLSILQLLMLVRAIISWIPMDEDSAIGNFVFAMTEPVIFPVRMLLERFEFVASSPIDISFFAALLIISALQMLLPTVI